MGCGGRCGNGKYQLGVCRCHELIEKETKPRLVRFCNLCGVWLCKHCEQSPARRVQAFGLHVLDWIFD